MILGSGARQAIAQSWVFCPYSGYLKSLLASYCIICYLLKQFCLIVCNILMPCLLLFWAKATLAGWINGDSYLKDTPSKSYLHESFWWLMLWPTFILNKLFCCLVQSSFQAGSHLLSFNCFLVRSLQWHWKGCSNTATATTKNKIK